MVEYALMKNLPRLEQVAHIHQRAFLDAERHMPADKLALFTGWVATHTDYSPTFSERLHNAVEWTRQYPDVFKMMVTDFDAALEYLNGPDSAVDEEVFTNLAAYPNASKEHYLN